MFLSRYVTNSDGLHSSDVCLNDLTKFYPDGRIIPHNADAITNGLQWVVYSNDSAVVVGYVLHLTRDFLPELTKKVFHSSSWTGQVSWGKKIKSSFKGPRIVWVWRHQEIDIEASALRHKQEKYSNTSEKWKVVLMMCFDLQRNISFSFVNME